MNYAEANKNLGSDSRDEIRPTHGRRANVGSGSDGGHDSDILRMYQGSRFDET
jgi:hypothetical protein